MPDRDELDLSVLSRTPVGALPGASAARRRGEQRTRRTRGALAGAGVLVTLVAVTAGTALSGGADRVAPAPFADRTPEPAAEDGLAVSLLDAEDVAGLRGEPWQVRPTDDLPFDPLPPGCGDPEEVFGTPAATALRFLDGDGRVVGHSLKGYADEAQAKAALGRMIDSIESCDGSPSVLLGGLPGSGPDRVYGRSLQGDSGVGFVVERFGAVLSGAALRAVRPAPADEELDPLAEAAAGAVEGGPFDAPDPGEPEQPAPPGADAALLDPDAASRVEPGTWTTSQPDPTRFFDPCAGEPALTAPPETASRTLVLPRKGGGSTVSHQVLLYATADDAAGALQELRSAVGTCAPAPTAGGDGTTAYEVLDERRFGDLVVRVVEQCRACPDSPSVVVVEQSGRGLSVLQVAVGEQGGPGVGLVGGYSELARERLEALVGEG